MKNNYLSPSSQMFIDCLGITLGSDLPKPKEIQYLADTEFLKWGVDNYRYYLFINPTKIRCATGHMSNGIFAYDKTFDYNEVAHDFIDVTKQYFRLK